MLTYKADRKSPLEYQQRSGILVASDLICEGKSTLIGALIIPDGTNAITVNFYDNTEGSGLTMLPQLVIDGTEKFFAIDFSPGLLAENGIYVDISVAGGGSCSYQVYYDN